MLNIISLGAGVQSTTMALMAAHGEITPMPDAAIFADTQAEPKSVYSHLARLREAALPFPIHLVSRGSLTTDTLQLRKSKKTGRTYLKTLIPFFTSEMAPVFERRVPDGDGPLINTQIPVLNSAGEQIVEAKTGMLFRKCTADYKIAELIKMQRKLVGAATVRAWRSEWKKTGVKPPPLVRCWIGISTDEIVRMKESREDWIENVFPLIDARMSRDDCHKKLASFGWTAPKSACTYCPYHDDKEWLRLKTEEPEDFADAARFESQIHALHKKQTAMRGQLYLHRSRKPLGEIDFAYLVDAKTNKQGDLISWLDECEGMCGV